MADFSLSTIQVLWHVVVHLLDEALVLSYLMTSSVLEMKQVSLTVLTEELVDIIVGMVKMLEPSVNVS